MAENNGRAANRRGLGRPSRRGSLGNPGGRPKEVVHVPRVGPSANGGTLRVHDLAFRNTTGRRRCTARRTRPRTQSRPADNKQGRHRLRG